MTIELQHVSKRFGRVTALADVTLDVPSGSRVGLIGPNGSGKSTLTRVVIGLLAAEGRVRIGGLSPFADRVRLARRLAYVPQSAPALGAPVREIVRAIATIRGLPTAAVAGRARALGLDVEQLAARPFRSLSGGTKQKLVIALAMAAESSLLVMDEPTAGLDPEARRRFFRLFDAVAPTTTVVLCSHRLEELQHLIDHVVLLEEGRLAWSGSLDAFLARRATTVLEIRASSEARVRWLRELGYAPGTSAWWWKLVPRARKADEITRLVAGAGSDLADLLVRDLESVEAGAAAAEDAGAA